MASVIQTLIVFNRANDGCSEDVLFTDNWHGFVILMAILVGVSIVLSYYGVKAVFESVFTGNKKAPPKLVQDAAVDERQAE